MTPGRFPEKREICQVCIIITVFACIKKKSKQIDYIKADFSAGNNFYLFTGHISYQISFGRTFDKTGHNLLTENTLKKITENVPVRCSVIVFDHNVKLAGYLQNLVRQCPMTDYYFQYCDIYATKYLLKSFAIEPSSRKRYILQAKLWIRYDSASIYSFPPKEARNYILVKHQNCFQLFAEVSTIGELALWGERMLNVLNFHPE